MLFMETQEVKISDLKFAKYNPRQISNDDMASLVNSIREFGMVEPVVVNKDNHVVGGHQRLIACKQLSIDTVPVVYVDLPKKKEKILNLALNRIHGDWNMDKLAVVLEELKMDDGDDLSLTGFSEIEIGEILDSQIGDNGSEDNFDAESVASKIKKPKSKRGQIYQLGRHRLMCGDATSKEDVEKLMDGKKADMVFTDPPYGIGYLPDSNLKKLGKLKNDNRSGRWDNFEEFQKFLNVSMCMILQFMGEGACYYICMGWEHLGDILNPLAQRNCRAYSVIVWDRMTPRITSYPQDYIPVNEFIVYGWKRGKDRQRPSNGKEQTTIWRFKTEKSIDMEHTTQKPITIVVNALLNSSSGNNLILDTFGGSGTTLIAAEKTGRVCYMMEIDPVYCDVIRNRYEKYVREK